MQPFTYVAYNAKGQRKTGTLVAESERAAFDALKAQGLMASDIEAKGRAKAEKRPTGAKLDAEERAIFSRQMAIEAGRSGFPRYYTSSLRAGESSGDLAAVFSGLADFLEAQGANRAEIATALVYPAFVAAVSLLVCVILVTNVAPEVVAMFEVSGRELPQLTQVVLGASEWIQVNWVAIVAALGVLVVGGLLAWRVPAIRNIADRIGLAIPLFGRLRRLSIAAQYLRTMALVLGSRQTAVNAVIGAADVLTVQSYRRQADDIVTAVRQGESLSGAVRKFKLLPPVALQLIRVGEESARLAQMTERAAVLVETWLANDRKRIAAVLDPVLMMVVGAFVLIIVLAILLPIFELQSVVIG